MSGRPKTPLVLGATEREQLIALTKRRKTAQALALRARIVLACAEGLDNKVVAARQRVTQQTVSKWRGRCVELRMDGLLDAPRPGAPRTIEDERVDAVIAKTLESVPTGATHWSTRSMAQAMGMSQTAVSRIWRAFGLQPHRQETFKLSSDPFLSKRSATLSACTWTRHSRRWCCAWMRRVKYRHWTAHSQSCRWHRVFLSAEPTITCAMERRRCLRHWTLPRAK